MGIRINPRQLILSSVTFLITLIPILSIGICESVTLEYIHMLISLICSFSLFAYEDKPFSCFKVFHVFYLFFFGIAPILQYKQDVHLFHTYFTEELYIQTSLYLLASLIGFNILYGLYTSRLIRKYNTYAEFTKEEEEEGEVFFHLTNSKKVFMILISVFVCLIYLFLHNFDFTLVFLRGGAKYHGITLDSTLGLVVDHILRPLPLFMLIAAIIVKDKILSVILFLLFFISNPFTGMGRNGVAAMYLPFVLYTFSFFRKRNVFTMTMVFGLLVVFPFLNQFRINEKTHNLSLSFDLNFDQFLDLNFDAYSMFMRVLKEDIVTNGYQLLGALFFWVPRSLWASKPIGSGHFIANYTHLSFSNLSMPYIAEGYLNFGVIGVVLFVIILALLFAKLDAQYWHQTRFYARGIEGAKYFLIIGMVMFIMRGDLLSSTAYTIGYILSYYLAKAIFGKSLRKITS